LTSTNIDDDYSSIQKYPKNGTENNNDYLKSENYAPDNEITFTNRSYRYCIGIISIVNLSQEIIELDNPVEIRKYYSIFIIQWLQ
jgi:hypothetical protein